jgi:hypothetical protein
MTCLRKSVGKGARWQFLDPDESAAEAFGDWHYWSPRVTPFDLGTATETLTMLHQIAVRLVQQAEDIPFNLPSWAQAGRRVELRKLLN